jgi:hypothetical protein
MLSEITRGALDPRPGPGCLNTFSASISGASAGVRAARLVRGHPPLRHQERLGAAQSNCHSRGFRCTNQAFVDRIAPAARNIHAYWLARRAPQERPRRPVHKAPAPGRNDLCPCGSGKKFKRCHGATDALH